MKMGNAAMLDLYPWTHILLITPTTLFSCLCLSVSSFVTAFPSLPHPQLVTLFITEFSIPLCMFCAPLWPAVRLCLYVIWYVLIRRVLALFITALNMTQFLYPGKRGSKCCRLTIQSASGKHCTLVMHYFWILLILSLPQLKCLWSSYYTAVMAAISVLLSS